MFAATFALLVSLYHSNVITAQEVTPKDLKEQAQRFAHTDYMIPMRDGVKLHTTVYVPKDGKEPLPFVMMRTPYGIESRGPKALKEYFRDLADEGYIFVFQDIRGRHKSEGQFVMMRPPRDSQDPRAIDEATDTNDTIDWLLKNVPNHNGRVGMLGVSYPGWLTVMALVDPHPALKAASPQAPPADMFFGDDFHHNGAFRLSYGFEYVAMMETDKQNTMFAFDRFDTFEWYLKLGALSNVNPKYFQGKLPTWNDFVAHPNYDEFWKKQSSAPYLKRVSVPTLHVAGWFDQEDFYGPLKTYELLERHDHNGQNFLAVGPWNHGGWESGPGEKLGRIPFDSDTGKHFRAKVQASFFAQYLKDKGEKPPEALLFQTGSNKWVGHERWPPQAANTRKLYFHPQGKLAFTPPENAPTAFDSYVSDPAKPVPYRPRPITPTYPGPEWQVWMVEDQRFAQHRPDVLTYETDPLAEDVTLAGSVTAQLFAATSGTDCDWIVRLIDVFPEKVEKHSALGGYQLLISGEPIRARFRKSFETPEPVVPDEVNEYTIDLHWNHHCFRKGHKIMVQVQSTWFPLIDRNPQKYVPNIFTALDSDFQPARQQVFRSPRFPSGINMQVLNESVAKPSANAGPADLESRIGANVSSPLAENWDYVAAMKKVAARFRGHQGVVLHVGGSMTIANPYCTWARSGKGKTPEDEAILKWMHTDKKDKTDGWWLCRTEVEPYRAYTAESGLKAAMLLDGGKRGLPPLAKMLDEYQPQMVTIECGIYDIEDGVSLDDYQQRMGTALDLILGRDAIPILNTIPPFQAQLERTRQFNGALRALAKDRGLPLVDLEREIETRRPNDWFGTLMKRIHLTASETGGSPSAEPNSENLRKSGYLLRCWLTVRKIAEIKQRVLDSSKD